MKPIKLTLLLLLFTISFCNANNWMNSLDNAKKIAIATNKLILVDFWASWCGPCVRMDRESWEKDEIKELMKHYVPVKINLDDNRALASKYGVNGIPYIFIMDANGEVLYHSMSYKRKNEVKILLDKYALNTSLLNRELAHYHKKVSFAPSYRLAKKYLEFTVHVDNSIKRDFIDLTNKYFKSSLKLLKKSKLKNKAFFIQNIKLLQIKENLILNKPKKALKQLSKIKTVLKRNNKLFNTLSYISHHKLQQVVKANKHKALLTEVDIKKAAILL